MRNAGVVWTDCEVSVLRHPLDVKTLRTVRVRGVELCCLDPAALTRENLFAIGFDEVLARLARQDRTDVEPDGFFIRSGEEDGRVWRLNGHLFELDERLWRVDLRGDCPPRAVDEILATLGWPETPVVFQLVRHGVTVGEDDFRRWAAIGEG